MEYDIIQGRDFSSEFKFSTSRSGGPGGQNVNKVSTKVELRFNVAQSVLLLPEEKVVILKKLENKINKEGELVLVSQSERSQLANKEKVVEKFYSLIVKALTPRKKRKPTKQTKASKEKRLQTKKINSEKKSRRKSVDLT
ncbi:MAG TPA: alternative ribosome rescue aminoacyl-tRNA hydrolase ArfB [Tenuifilaceae bacterium]|nr:alternative ribosome rescue aminoacyl-tRNA hydrolase ArfB [Tenuifilaceae bacterium]HRX30262.1 alternative ribosome rescue aminoacyl-tRNA hydrolase ArfB [Tenuifilaceae bacterium]